MKVLVTGANGMLGKDLCPILEDAGAFVIETDIDNLDITNSKIVDDVLTQIRPDMVIHCAAYTNVDKAEEDFETAEKINAKGTENISKICAKLDIPVIYISTDYVFDGTKLTPYAPDDLTNPLNNYGLTKLHGEEYIRKYCKKHYIVRTSWLYGHHGKNFVETMISMFDKPEIKVVNDQIGCPTWTIELANGILKLLSKPYGTYHVCGGGTTSWYGFATEIQNQLNNMPDTIHSSTKILPCTTEEFPRPAKRPLYSVMDNQGLCRNWQAALHDYLELRNI